MFKHVLKATSAFVACIAALVLLANFAPLVGIVAAGLIGLFMFFAAKRPLPQLWLPYTTLNITLAFFCLIAVAVSASNFSEQLIAQQAALKEQREAKLANLKATDPTIYLSELKNTGDARWESEFKVLDPAGYERYQKEIATRQEEEKQANVRKYIEQLKTTSQTDIDAMYNIYYQLSVLRPNVQEYATKRKAFSAKLEERRQLQEMKMYPSRYVTLENFSWSKGGFGSIMIANFTIKNGLPNPVKDIEIKCTLSGPSGTVIDYNTRTIYERIPAKSTKMISEFNMGFVHSQSARSSCEIVGLNSL